MKNNTPLILSFSNIRATDLPLVGGKAANLGEMTHAGFPIPGGFCLTTTAFQQFLDASSDSQNIYKQLDAIATDDVETVRSVGEQIRQSLLTVPMPADIVEAVKQAWQTTGIEHAYAVRSSATAEDLPGASFAGQQDTYLNIIGEASLLDAIRRCWVSLFTDRAILYRAQNNFPHRDVQLSVVVQQMIMSETSGILFTADPLTGHRHTLTIDASFGLGEALVGGLVSPDAYHVDKRKRVILDRQIADKLTGIFPEKGGGTRQVTLGEAQRQQTVLTDVQILGLADLGSRVEAHYGTPQDIEWAIVRDQVYLLQARPITSLYPIDGLKSPDGSLHIYFSMGHQQNMTNAMSPLSMSSMRVLGSAAGHAPNQIESSIMLANGGRLFIDLTSALRHPILGRVVPNALAQMDALAPETIRIAMRRPEFQRPHALRISFSALRGVLGFVSKIMHALWRQDVTGYVEQTNQLIQRHLDDTQTKLDTLPIGKAQIEAMIEFFATIYQIVLNWVPRFIAGEASKRILGRFAGKWADPVEVEALSLGLPGNVVTDMNLALGDLADIARQSPQLTDLFRHLDNDSQAWLSKASMMEDSSDFLRAWSAFLDQYGSRGSAEIDIRAPHWYEEPLTLLQVIASALQQGAGHHRAVQQRLVREREAAVSKIIEGASHGLAGGFQVRLLKRLIAVQNEYSVLREHHKFMFLRAMRLIKEMLKKTAVELVNKQKLVAPDDIWFLSWPELLKIWDVDAPDYASLLPERRVNLERYQKTAPPLIITSDGESPVVKYKVTDAPPGALVGNPVSSGVVEGVIHVIHDPQTELLHPREILVAVFTDPGWTPLFINAGGLIMEVGGQLTHGSVVAREYGIPAVVGVRDATKKLQTGQKVRVDGNRGIIEII
jgi:pyruvate,water dikinase